MTFDVIGGKADATTFESHGALIVSRPIAGDQYIAIEFPAVADDKSRMVTIYMLAGTTPAEAMRIWRERNMNTEHTEEQWDSLCANARELIKATPTTIAQEGAENFLAMIEVTFKALEHTKPRVGRGSLMVELGLLRADIRDHPERYVGIVTTISVPNSGGKHRETVPHEAPAPSKALGKPCPQDAEVGGQLCPECHGHEVHNADCSQKDMSSGGERSTTVPGEAVQSGVLCRGRDDPPPLASPAVIDVEVERVEPDEDDKPW